MIPDFALFLIYWLLSKR